MPFVQAGDIRMHYAERGAGPTAVLFVHGYVSCHDWWRPQLDALAGRYRMYALDLRGAGDTDRPADGYNIPQYAEDVYHAVQALGLRDFVYVGHSMGGLIGMQFALAHQDLLKGLVLVDPAPADGLTRPEGSEGEDAALMQQFKSNRAVADAFLRQAALLRDIDPEIYETILTKAMSVSDGHLAESVASMMGVRLGDRLGEIRVPALMVVGDSDRLVPPETMLQSYKRIPGCGLHVFHRVGHSPQLEVPDAFNQVLVDFMEHTIPAAAGEQ